MTKPCGHVICKPCVQQFMLPSEDSDPDAKLQCYVCDTDLSPAPPSAPGHSYKSSRHNKHEEKDGDEKGDGSTRKSHEQERGIIEIDTQASGTGFAGAGKNVVAKEGVAFQC